MLALWRQWDAIGDRHLPRVVWAYVAGLAFSYGLLLLIVAEAWHRLVSDFARRPLPRQVTLASYAVTQIAKYIPGNIFNYLGRHAWMTRAGIANAVLLKALSWETVFMLISAAIFSVLSFIVFPTTIAAIPHEFLQNIAIAVAVIAIVTTIIATTRPQVMHFIGDFRPKLSTAIRVVALLVVFFSVYALVFVSIGDLIIGRPVWSLMTVAVVSWIVGFVPLGSPAGLGTREAMILLLSGPLIGSSNALLVAAMFRLVTITGDIVCYGVGRAIHRLRPGLTVETP